MNSWEKLIEWFDHAKRIVDVSVDDNFKVVSGDVVIDGQKLQVYMIRFWLQEGYVNENDFLSFFDLTDTNNRIWLKSHLVDFLDASHSF